jgi:D-glycero-alpha-D-manno-heptose 1-phosphate guanylyltransferase
MAPVLGRPFLAWMISFLARQGIREATIATGYRGEIIETHFEKHPGNGITVQCVREDRALGTAGGFRHAVLGSAFQPAAWLVLNGDSLVLTRIASLTEPLMNPDVDGVILGVTASDTARYGRIESGPDGDLLRFDEKRPGAGLINAGVYLLRASTIEAFPARIPLSFERDVFPPLTLAGCRFKVVVRDAPFIDIGTPESLAAAEDFVRRHGRDFLGL